MKQIQKLVITSLIVFCLGLCSSVYAEYIHYGDYTTPSGVVDGDLVIIGGDLTTSLTVNGDLKIVTGVVNISSGDLRVHGDLIVTNTNLSNPDDASVAVDYGTLHVTGAIMTRSPNKNAFVRASKGINAGRIITNGKLSSYVNSSAGSIEVEGEIVVRSSGGSGYVSAPQGNIKAASISTDGYDVVSVYVAAGISIDVTGSIVTHCLNGVAYVRAASYGGGGIKAGSILTCGTTSGYVLSGDVSFVGYIDVVGDIVINGGSSYVRSYLADIKAANIITNGPSNGYVHAGHGIDVKEKIETKSSSASAYVYAETAGIKAKSITTNGSSSSYVSANTTLDVAGAIVARSSANIAYVSSGGNMTAGSITTDASGTAAVFSTSGGIEVFGTIATKSTGATAYISTGFGDIKAENIFTYGNYSSYISATGAITVKNAIKTQSGDDPAYVSAGTNITAHSIITNGYSHAYVQSANNSITVDGDIYTKSTGGGTYVKAENGNITARSIKTEASVGQDDSIKAASGSARFEWVPNVSDAAVSIKDSHFYFDHDYVWNTQLTIDGTCTIDGNGQKLTFDSAGEIIVSSGASLLLKNIKLSELGGIAIRCADNTATLSVQDLIWSQTSDFTFNNGQLQCVGDLFVKGPGTRFIYSSSQTCSLHKNAMLSFSHSVTFSYDSSSATNLAMTDNSSRLHFDSSMMQVAQDMRLVNGTIEFDNLVTFSSEGGKTLYFGNGVSANNLALEFKSGSKLGFYGILLNVNV